MWSNISTGRKEVQGNQSVVCKILDWINQKGKRLSQIFTSAVTTFQSLSSNILLERIIWKHLVVILYGKCMLWCLQGESPTTEVRGLKNQWHSLSPEDSLRTTTSINFISTWWGTHCLSQWGDCHFAHWNLHIDKVWSSSKKESVRKIHSSQLDNLSLLWALPTEDTVQSFW